MKLGAKTVKENRKLGGGNSKKNRNFKVIFLNVGLVLSGAVLTVVVYQFVALPKIIDAERNQTIKEVTSSNSEYVQAWKLNKDIDKGGKVDIQNDLEKITVSSAGVSTDYIKDRTQIKDLVARIKLTSGTVISSEMLVDMGQAISDTTKNQDYDWIKVHSFAKQEDFVDIHYKKPDGSDYIVASKKKLINLNGQVFSINLSDENERAYINNATVAAAVSGGTLYTSIYPEPENQPAAEVTYKMNDEIKRAIEKDPSVLNNAKDKLKSGNSTNSTTSKNTASTTTKSNSNNTSSDSEKTTEQKPPMANYVAGQ